MIKRLWDGICDLLHDGGPSMTRVINFIVALTGCWLLWYTARGNGQMDWPWALCFVAYLAYGAGPGTLKYYFQMLQSIKGGGSITTETVTAKASVTTTTNETKTDPVDPSLRPPKE